MTDKMKICVLGNSHLASMKTGWDLVRDTTPEYELTFFGAPKAMMDDLSLEGNALVPGTDKLRRKLSMFSEGSESIDLDSFDAFVVVGLQFGPRRLAQLYRTHRPVSFEWRGPLNNLAPMVSKKQQVTAISERLFNDAMIAGLTDTMAIRIIDMIRDVTEKPVYLVSAPYFSELALETGDWDAVIGSGDVDLLAQRFRKYARHACPVHVNLVLTPNRLTTHGFFTAKEFAVAPTDDGFQDLVHTTDEYGAAMLRSVFATMRKTERHEQSTAAVKAA
jgi:hypothetical protein